MSRLYLSFKIQIALQQCLLSHINSSKEIAISFCSEAYPFKKKTTVLLIDFPKAEYLFMLPFSHEDEARSKAPCNTILCILPFLAG